MKEKPKITYLLGAGASAQTFPTYQNFNKTFKDFRAYIENMKQRSLSNPYDIGLVAGSITYDPMDVQRILQEDLMKFEQELYKHNSPDVIARKYFLKGDYRNLGLLKITIDLFFKYLHYSKHTDPRYDAFFSMISNRVNDNIEFDNDCKILTWNYDIKIELSMSGFFNLKDISDLKDYLQILPRANDKKIDKYTFTIYKLNGSSNSSFSNEGYVIRQFKTDDISYLSTGYHQNERDTINRKIIKDYFHYKYVIESDIDNKKDFVHGIRYAWENEHVGVKHTREGAYDIIADTEVLIVIGYSFPYFNRSIDDTLIRKMTKLNTIYIQDTKETVDIIVEKFKEIWPEYKDKIKPIINDKEFYIPNYFSRPKKPTFKVY